MLLQISSVAEAGLSAKREVNEDWRAAAFRSGLSAVRIGTVENNQVPFDKVDLSQIPEWPKAELQRLFAFLRDRRFIEDPDQKTFLRRISWLYPDDGCFTRAGFMTHILRSENVLQPLRVFVFGDLSVETPNSPDGQVSWWYHTALIVRSEGEVYVIDPAVNPLQPLSLKKWVKAQAKEDPLISICSANAYDPDSQCDETRPMSEHQLQRDQDRYLIFERERQLELQRNPDEVLGEHPPWGQILYLRSNTY